MYVEPFLGGGAVLFDVQPKRALVNDINAEIINVYETIKDECNGLITELGKHINEADYFYKIRGLDRTDAFEKLSRVEKAARIIYLNKTCYNGLFRVNQQGQFNAPFGRYSSPNIVNEEVVRAVSRYLNNSTITFTSLDFEGLLPHIKKGAFVYLDPPYDPVSNTASFTGYAMDGFGRDDQLRLKNFCDQLHKKGVKFLLSNSATAFIKNLYADYKTEVIQVPRNINSNADKRGKVDEVLICNYDV
jgi:DNA adenine methylase